MAKPTSQFPNQVDLGYTPPNASLGFIPAGRLDVGVAPDSLTIKVVGVDFTKVPDQGIVFVGDEQVVYNSKDSVLTELYVATVNNRGFGDTTATAHLAGEAVTWPITREHFEFTNKAIQATQQYVGVEGSSDTSTLTGRIKDLELATSTSGELVKEIFTVNSAMLTDKYIAFNNTVKNTSEVILMVIGGGPQENGADFTVTDIGGHTVVGWAGLSLDGLLATGDKLLIMYERI